jgi:phage gp36-like protein
MYLTPAALILRFGREEMAQLSDRAIPRAVSGELLAAGAEQGDLSAWTGDEMTAAGKALAVIELAIIDAQSEVDSYLSARYNTPLNPAPGVIARYTGDVARYLLYEDHATEEVRRRYEDALVFLRAVAAGKAAVVEAQGAEPPASGGGMVEMVSAGRIFNRGGEK